MPNTFLRPEQYLEIERKAEFWSEYLHGEMFTMAQEGESHNLVRGNVVGELYQQLRTRPCFVYARDMRLHISTSGLYVYPDVAVVCGESKFQDDWHDNLLNPTVIVEVHSPSTEAYDRGEKFAHYRSIESLREYLLVSSERIGADLFTRQDDNRWLLTATTHLEDVIELKSIDCRLSLADVYEKVDLALTRTATPESDRSATRATPA